MLLGARAVTRRRFQPLKYSGHKPVAQVPATSTIYATIQPMMGEELQLLPEGDRARDVQKLYTEGDVRGLDEMNQVPPDEIVYEGNIYEVHRVEIHGAGAPLPHRKAILMRKQL